MEKRIVILAILLTICVHLTCADITTIQCCTCNSMMPIGVNTQPQVYPSPFKIKIDPKALEYEARGVDINGKQHRGLHYNNPRKNGNFQMKNCDIVAKKIDRCTR